MEIELSDVSGLPDALKPLAQEADGKFKLDLSKVAPASDLERFKAKAVTAEQEAIERRKALKAWESLGATPDELRAKIEKGADPQIIDQMRKQHGDELAGWQQKYTGVLSRVATAELRSELSKAGVVPEGLDLLASFAASRIQFDDDGNARVMSDDGKSPMVGSGPNGGATLADLAKQLASKIPHLVADNGKGGGGKSHQQGGDGVKTIPRAQFDSMSQGERASFFKSGGKVAD